MSNWTRKYTEKTSFNSDLFASAVLADAAIGWRLIGDGVHKPVGDVYWRSSVKRQPADTVIVTLYGAGIPSSAQISALDAIMAAHGPVPILQGSRYREIDKRTEQLIRAGFTYRVDGNDETFSGSDAAQRSLTAAYAGRDLVAYPLKWLTADDSVSLSIADATELATFYTVALGAMLAHRASGSTLKEAVRAAGTEDAINLIVDSR